MENKSLPQIESTPVETGNNPIQPQSHSKMNLLLILGVVVTILILGIIASLLFLEKKNTNLVFSEQKKVDAPTGIPAVTEKQIENNNKQVLSYAASNGLVVIDPLINKTLFSSKDSQSYYTSWDFSPDKSKIITSSGYLFDIKNNTAKKIITAGCPNWSPDGKTIVFQNNGLSIMDENGENVRKMNVDQSANLCGGKNSVFHWFPDNKRFMYYVSNPSKVYIHDIETNTSEELYNAQDNYLRAATLSHDGSKVAFTMMPPSQAAGPENLYVLDVNTKAVVQLTHIDDGVYQIDQPIFTIDSKKVILPINNTSSKYAGLNLIDITTKQIESLSKDIPDGYAPPSVSSDGKYVTYASFEAGKSVIYTIDLNTKQKIKVAEGGFPLWSK